MYIYACTLMYIFSELSWVFRAISEFDHKARHPASRIVLFVVKILAIL